MSDIVIPDAGWHDVPMQEYLHWPFVSSGMLRTVSVGTAAHVHDALYGEEGSGEKTASYVFGSLAHTALLEPDLLESEYVIEPEPDPDRFKTAKGEPASNVRATAGWKEAIAELEKTGKQIVSAADYRAAITLRDQAYSLRSAKLLLQAQGPVELSGHTVDPETGVPFKIRPDKLVEALGANVQIKTTDDASLDGFARSVAQYYYDRAMAFYAIVLHALGFNHRKPIFILLEKGRPGLVAVRELDTGAMDAGEQHARALLRKVSDYMAADKWPGYPDEIVAQSLPHWAWARRDEELQRIEHGY